MAKQIPQGERDLGRVVATVRQLTNEGAALDTRLTAAEADIDALEAVTHREVLTANRTYYVRNDGSNSNTGLANTSGGAFLTAQKGVDVALGNLDLAGFNVTIQLSGYSGSPVTFTGNVSAASPQVGAGTITIAGDTSNPDRYIVTSSSGTTISVVGAGSVLAVQGFEIRSAAGIGLVAQAGGTLYVTGAMRFGTCSSAHMRANFGTVLAENTSWSIVGNATEHLSASPNSLISTFGSTITVPVATSVTFSGSFVLANRLALVSCTSTTITVSGTVTGKRYSAILNSVIFTNGAGASFFPGTVAGTTATGGIYG